MDKNLTAFKHYLHSLWLKVPGLLSLAFGLLLVGSFTEGIGILMLVPVVNAMAEPSQAVPQWLSFIPGVQFTPDDLKFILLLFLMLLLVRASLVYLRERLLTHIRLQTTDDLRRQLFEALLFSDWSQRVHSEQHQELEQLTNGVSRVGIATFYILKLVTNLVLLLVYAAVSLLIAPIALLFACVVGMIGWVLFRQVFRQAAAFGFGLTHSNKQLYQRVMFFLNGMKTVKACAFEARQLQAFEASQLELRENQQAYQNKTALQQLGFQGVTATLLCLLVYIGSQVWHLGVAQLVVLIVMFGRMMPMLSEIQANIQRIMHMLPAFVDIEQSIRINKMAAESQSSVPVSFPLRRLALENIHFAYPDREAILTNATLEFPLHRITLIQGASGQGKTTVIDLLSSLLLPHSGALILDERPLQAEERHSWRHQISYLSQESFLFHGTIRENLLWGEVCDDAEIWQTLALCCADFVADLPQQLDTLIGERGAQLSGGQRQRLVLARALLRKRPLLILDEATNALDSATEYQVFLALRQLSSSMTVVIVSHSEQAQAFADHLVSLR